MKLGLATMKNLVVCYDRQAVSFGHDDVPAYSGVLSTSLLRGTRSDKMSQWHHPLLDNIYLSKSGFYMK